MQPGYDLLGVALVVEAEQAVEDFAAGGFAEGVAEALFGVVEAVAEVEGTGGAVPAVGGGDGLVHLDVEGAQFGDVGAGLGRVVEAVVGLGQALLAGLHDLLAMAVVALADGFEVGEVVGEGEGFEGIRSDILKSSF